MIIEFLKKIFLVDMLRGLVVTLRYYFSPKLTIQYPERIKQPRERFRGLLRLFRDETGEPLCIACKLCQRACPNYCFDIEGARNENNKMRPTKYDWKLDRCTFCGFCVEVCPTAAIRFTKEFRLSTTMKPQLLFHLDTMYVEYDVNKHLKGDLAK